jgi:hypothetical protein
LIETDQQRRWWFATHPEYSHRSTGRRGAKSDDSDKIDPERVDDWADERLKDERDPVAIELLNQAKFWFGTEFASKPPGEQYAFLAEEHPVGSDALFAGKPKDDSPPPGLPSREEGRRLMEKVIREDISPVSLSGVLDKLPALRGLKFKDAVKEISNALLKRAGRDVVVNAAKKGTSEGPGKWVEVKRGKYGLEHQSKMSGQPIRESEGKRYINEYEVNGVKFDDYRDGILYEYKGNYSNFIVRKAREFYEWFKGSKSAREQARRQAEAARGIPVRWRVGPPNQVEAFRKAVGELPGVKIEP